MSETAFIFKALSSNPSKKKKKKITAGYVKLVNDRKENTQIVDFFTQGNHCHDSTKNSFETIGINLLVFAVKNYFSLERCGCLEQMCLWMK